ncbi:coiled-coil domain-containing protein 186 [Lepeophtheirus salmonis]|nr:coiled-coil domain-containing protein 186-like [Lepeophtheirus salmonis]
MEEGSTQDSEELPHPVSSDDAHQDENDAEAELEEVNICESPLERDWEAEISALKEELEEKVVLVKGYDSEISDLRKKFQMAKRDKESMVVKYAMGEKDVIKIRKAKEDADKKIKTLSKEKEDLSNKIKSVSSERTRLQQLCDSRQQDLVVSKKDAECWMEEFKCQEAKASLSASRLKAEVDAHRETREQLDITVKHLAETRGEIDGTRKEYQEFIQRLRNEEKQKKAAEQTKQVKLLIDEAAASELVKLKEKYKTALSENEILNSKIVSMECNQIEMNATMDQLKETVNSQKSQIDDLISQVAENEDLKTRFNLELDKSSSKTKEFEELIDEMKGVKEDMISCRKKESELLSFTEKLTETNVNLQSEFDLLKASSSVLEAENSKLVKSISSLEKEFSIIQTALNEEKRTHREDSEVLAKKLAEKSKVVDTSSQKIIDLENEISVLKRKNAAKLKELTRELLSCSKKRSDALNGSSPVISSSRTSSSSSLNKLTYDETNNYSSKNLCVPENGLEAQRKHSNSSQHNVPVNGPDFSLAQVPDSQVLIEKIVKLQRNLARKVEKQEFMEEHIETLQKEVKKKNKVIQSYVLKQEPGALASSVMDDNKREMLGHGGIMASLYSSTPSDANMTLDLSLEINQKLQAVLEDTLLKNITLKENINTLGNEIASISSIQGKI